MWGPSSSRDSHFPLLFSFITAADFQSIQYPVERAVLDFKVMVAKETLLENVRHLDVVTL